MKKVNIAKLKNELSHYISYVKHGGIVQVMDRNMPVAEIIPFGMKTQRGADDLLQRMEKQGFLTRSHKALGKDFFAWSSAGPEAGVLAELLAERKGGR